MVFTAYFMDGRGQFALHEPMFTIKAFKNPPRPIWSLHEDDVVAPEIIFYRLVLPIRQGDDIVAGMYKLEKDHVPMDIAQLVKVAGSDAEAAGWHSDRPQPHNYATEEVFDSAYLNWVGNKLMLTVGEINEAHDEIRNGKNVHEVYYNPGKDKPEGLPTELADAVIRIADFCESEGIDLEAAIQLKLAYNRSRGFKHGGKKF